MNERGSQAADEHKAPRRPVTGQELALEVVLPIGAPEACQIRQSPNQGARGLLPSLIWQPRHH